MTRRKKLLVATAAVLATTAAVLTSNVHWKLYGWVRGEPFCEGLPASYYSVQIRRNAELVWTGSGVLRDVRMSLFWRDISWTRTADAVPVLTALLTDSGPEVRSFA